MAKETVTARRTRRIRNQVKKVANGRPRLSVYRSNKNISVQIIDDKKGVTLAAASTLDKELKEKLKGKSSNVAAAKAVGALVAERAKKASITKVVFDRGAYLYHGRVKALADSAREGGLEF